MMAALKSQRLFDTTKSSRFCFPQKEVTVMVVDEEKSHHQQRTFSFSSERYHANLRRFRCRTARLKRSARLRDQKLAKLVEGVIIFTIRSGEKFRPKPLAYTPITK